MYRAACQPKHSGRARPIIRRVNAHVPAPRPRKDPVSSAGRSNERGMADHCETSGTRQLTVASGPVTAQLMGAMLNFRSRCVEPGSAEWYVSQSPPSGPVTTFWPPGPMTCRGRGSGQCMAQRGEGFTLQTRCSRQHGMAPIAGTAAHADQIGPCKWSAALP